MSDANEGSSSSTHKRKIMLINTLLRFTALAFSIASLYVMVKNNQHVESYGNIDFKNLSGFKYLVWSNGICAVYAFLSSLVSCFRLFNCDWLLFVLDQVTAYIMVTSSSAVIEILYLAHEGDRNVGWSELCSYYGNFCKNAKISLMLHLIALLCYLLLSLISGYTLFSKYDAPLLSENNDV